MDTGPAGETGKPPDPLPEAAPVAQGPGRASRSNMPHTGFARVHQTCAHGYRPDTQQRWEGVAPTAPDWRPTTKTNQRAAEQTSSTARSQPQPQGRGQPPNPVPAPPCGGTTSDSTAPAEPL